jgi:ATP-binding cassette, subfamily B, bacterial
MQGRPQVLGELLRADRPLAIAWWFVLLLRGLLPALFAIAMGVLVSSRKTANAK